MSLKIIDSHLHFFDLATGQYSWLKHNPPAWQNLDKIRQSHHLASIPPHPQFALEALIHVEAGFDNLHPENELHWLAQTLAPFPYKAVGYAPIDAPPAQFRQAIDNLIHPSLVAIRDITEGNDSQRLHTPWLGENLTYLAKQALHFEAQLAFQHDGEIERLLTLAEQHNQLTLVFNHAGFIDNEHMAKDDLKRISLLDNVMIKCSGLEMLANPLPLATWLHHLIEHAGEESLMLGSNYPVSLMQKSYWQVWQDYFNVIGNSSTWHKLSRENAKRCYGL
ncbi:amidohydrolase family protein [Pseudoalteromonas piscicida]|uniref:amidohydrolase family protein n=1 Tax=Pseudoalteromonas piscicida TaxID=43662 RepID=UPI0030A9E0DE